MNKGKYIVLEGPEGTGKGTQVERLALRLKAQGKKVIVVREPGSTPIGEEIRKLVKSSTLDRTVETEIFLISAARAELVRSVIMPALKEGAHVISDRSYLSTFAYQVAGAYKDLKEMAEILTKQAIGDTHPDFILVLDIDPQEGLKRSIKRNKGEPDRFDDRELEFHKKVRDAYLALAKESSYPVVDGSKSIEEVAEAVWAEVVRNG